MSAQCDGGQSLRLWLTCSEWDFRSGPEIKVSESCHEINPELPAAPKILRTDSRHATIISSPVGPILRPETAKINRELPINRPKRPHLVFFACMQ